ncbi:MAG TPA: UvrD-helicase domain-containing protein [Clostridia bacterium]|nr:UvrD-helicase domain-containing protein [Clostridia bacterium]
MEAFHQDCAEEQEYLEDTLRHVRQELGKELELLDGRKAELIKLRKEMWENTAHFSTDFEKLTEISQYLSSLGGQTASYASTIRQIGKYKRVLQSPYFGRFDFCEEDQEEREKIYVGIHSVIDAGSHSVIVYNWRAPISSIYYEYELGDAEYDTPGGIVAGKVLLKRQYKILEGKLLYFFDSSLKIDDEMLQKALSRSTSSRMRNIVETIQKEQNVIIRDTENELLIVQGVAGSGKTSIALHRIVYLLYQGLNNRLSSNNILIVSPNEIFSSYISGVIPELGEEAVGQMTFGELCEGLLEGRGNIEKRNEQLEYLITSDESESLFKRRRMEFKDSAAFAKLLDRVIKHYESNVIAFEDVYYDGKLIESKQVLRNLFLNGKITGTTAKRLKRLEKIIFDRVHPIQRERVAKIVGLVRKLEGHEFDYKAFGRLLSMKESGKLQKKVRSFTEVDYMEIYRLLFEDKKLFFELAHGLELPQDIEAILETTRINLQKGYIEYEDCAPLLYLKLSLEGSESFNEIRQVVIDEAQDYSPLQYMVFRLLFGKSRFTVLGDICQAIGKDGELALYEQIDKILGKNRSVQLFLNKSYRSSQEISAFSQGILKQPQDMIPFERHGEEPLVCCLPDEAKMEAAIVDRIAECLSEGFETVAVVCKTSTASYELYNKIKALADVKLVADENGRIEKGVVVIPSYLAKGLEFDAVIVHDASDRNYCTSLDRRLLYIACSRALHKLVLYYRGSRSRFITQ